MGDCEGSIFSLSSLMCEEEDDFTSNWKIRGEDDDSTYLNYGFNGNNNNDNGDPFLGLGVREEEEEYIQKLVEKETSFGFKDYVVCEDCSCMNQKWLQCGRLEAIEWILHVRDIFGFQLETAYLSIDYLDRFLSKRPIDGETWWAFRLLSVACLSLAAKMEECKVPALSDFPMVDYGFESNVIQKMELLVLSTLEWRMSSITPFAFLRYFISKFQSNCRAKDLISRATESIMTIIKDFNLMDHRPSTIGAAAVLAAFDDQMTRQKMQFKIEEISTIDSSEIEHIYTCYSHMQQGIKNGKSKTPKAVLSAKLSSKTSFENSSFIFGVGSKRRLTYNEYEQNYPSKKTCQE